MSMILSVGSIRSMTALQIATESSSKPKSVMNTNVCSVLFEDVCTGAGSCASILGKESRSTVISIAEAATPFLDDSMVLRKTGILNYEVRTVFFLTCHVERSAWRKSVASILIGAESKHPENVYGRNAASGNSPQGVSPPGSSD